MDPDLELRRGVGGGGGGVTGVVLFCSPCRLFFLLRFLLFLPIIRGDSISSRSATEFKETNNSRLQVQVVVTITTPEEFENGGFTLKTHQMFSFRTTLEEFKTATSHRSFQWICV